MATGRQRDLILILRSDVNHIRRFAGVLNTTHFSLPIPGENGIEIRIGDYRPVQLELHRLVRLWFQCGQNLKKMLDADRDLQRELLNIRFGLVPWRDGRPRLTLLDVGTLAPNEPLGVATGLFVLFLLNPYRNRLGGPCARCGKYYFKRTKRQTVYCSASCGRRATSKRANQERRTNEDEERIDLAKRLIRKFSERPRRDNWKEWVAKNPRLTKNWLSRAEKRGAISAPKRSRHHPH